MRLDYLVAVLLRHAIADEKRKHTDQIRIQYLGSGDRTIQALSARSRAAGSVRTCRSGCRSPKRRSPAHAAMRRPGQAARRQVKDITAPGTTKLQMVDALGPKHIELGREVVVDLIAKGAQNKLCTHHDPPFCYVDWRGFPHAESRQVRTQCIGVLRQGDFGIGHFGMPLFFPFHGQPAIIAGLCSAARICCGRHVAFAEQGQIPIRPTIGRRRRP